MSDAAREDFTVDDLSRAAALLAWLAIAVVSWRILEGFAVSAWGPNPRFLRSGPVTESTLWASELTLDPAASTRMAVTLQDGAVLHMIGRPLDDGPLRLVRVSTQPSLPSGLYRIELDRNRLHAEPLRPDETRSSPGDPNLGGWLTVNLEALRARLTDVDRWCFFTLAPGGSADGAISMRGDWLSTRNLVIALVVWLIAAGTVLDAARAVTVPSLARAARLALLGPAGLAALVAIDGAPSTPRIWGVIAVTLIWWALAFARREPRVDRTVWVIALVGIGAFVWVMSPPRVATLDLPATPVEVGADAPKPLRILCVGPDRSHRAAWHASRATWDLYPKVAARALGERLPERRIEVIDARGMLDSVGGAADLGALASRAHADVVAVEISTGARRVAWLPSLAFSSTRGDAATIASAVRQIRASGATPVLVVPPDPESFLSCDPNDTHPCGAASEAAITALQSESALLVDASTRPYPAHAWRVEPLLDATGTLNRWGEDELGRQLADTIANSVAER